jgi:hypothetical protein
VTSTSPGRKSNELSAWTNPAAVGDDGHVPTARPDHLREMLVTVGYSPRAPAACTADLRFA